MSTTAQETVDVERERAAKALYEHDTGTSALDMPLSVRLDYMTRVDVVRASLAPPPAERGALGGGVWTEDDLWQIDQAILDAENAPRPDGQIARLRNIYARMQATAHPRPPVAAPVGDEACDAIAATVKAMLAHRPVERTNDAMWRSAIRLGLAKVAP